MEFECDGCGAVLTDDTDGWNELSDAGWIMVVEDWFCPECAAEEGYEVEFL